MTRSSSGGSRISPRGANSSSAGGGGHQHRILPNFPENCMKSEEFGHPGGGRIPAPPLDPPMSRMCTAPLWGSALMPTPSKGRPPSKSRPLEGRPPVHRQTRVKTLPSRNFVCGGNNILSKEEAFLTPSISTNVVSCKIPKLRVGILNH